MVKRFRMPPPLSRRKASDGPINVVEAKGALNGEVRAGLVKAGVLEPYLLVRRRWLPYAERRLEGLSAVSAEDSEESPAYSERERAHILCQWMALLYVGKRLGTFQLLLEEKDGTQFDGTTLTMSSALTDLATIIGKHKAEAVFRQLEAVTTVVLQQHSGRSTL